MLVKVFWTYAWVFSFAIPRVGPKQGLWKHRFTNADFEVIEGRLVTMPTDQVTGINCPNNR
jgi:hypothetical protein